MNGVKEDDNSDLSDNQYINLYESMHDLNDKLLSLNYWKEFSYQFKCPPINRYYFCKQNNQAQQFFTFCCLSSYLIHKLSGNTDLKVDSFDDPNLTIDKIFNYAQQYIDVSSLTSTKHKFKQGFGIELIVFLSKLADKYWLENQRVEEEESASNIQVTVLSTDGTMVNLDEDNNEDDEVDNDDEDNEIELEEEFADYIIGEEANINEQEWEDILADIPEKGMIVANTDLAEWRLELERILPQLNVRLIGQNMYKSGAYDSEWRLHYQAATSHHSNIKNVFGQTDNMIKSLTNDLRLFLEKIHSKESYLQQNLDTILAEWTNVRGRALNLRKSYDELNKEVGEKSDRLQELSEEDKTTKQSIEEYSLRMTDSSPLLEAKKARELLKQELVKVNLQIGVAIQTLVRHVTIHKSYFY